MATSLYNINRTNVTDCVETLINDINDLRDDVITLTNAVETITVALAKQLGTDGKDILNDVDDMRGKEGFVYAQTPPVSHENDIGAVHSDKRDSARVD